MSIRRRHLLLGAAAACLVGCTASEQWRAVDVAAEPTALATVGTGLLIGTTGPGPGLVGPNGPIPVTATSPYGREARWLTLGVSGDRVVGIGSTRGGAHSNSRWTVFAGTATAAGLREQGQAFDVFHGWGAGELVAAVFAGRQPVIIGSWQSAATGNDIAVWLLDGATWRRRPSSGTQLASGPTSLLSASAAVGGERLVVVGQEIALGPVRTRAAAWTCTDPRGAWTRLDLPSSAAACSAQAVASVADGWLVAGRADDRLTAWRIDRSLEVTALEFPSIAATGAVRLAARPDGAALMAAGDGTSVQAVVGRPGAWQTATVPGGAVVAAAWADHAALLTSVAGRPLRLFALS